MTVNEGTRLKVAAYRTTQNKLKQLLAKLGETAANFNKLQQRHGCCVRSIDCECNICIGSAGCCVRSIDCECNLCTSSDPTSLSSEGLDSDETEIFRPSDFHVLDNAQVELNSLFLGCTRELDLSSVGSNTWLKYVKFKTTRAASYLFDKMSESDHVQVVHVLIRIKSKFSLVLVGNGPIAPVWDLGIGLKTEKLVSHVNNVRELLMDITDMFCLHRSFDSISRVWDTRWMWFIHPSVVHIDSICSGATIPTYSPVYSGKGDLFVRISSVSTKERALLWGSILQLTLHEDSKKVATIDLFVDNWSVEGCKIGRASQRRGSVMARSFYDFVTHEDPKRIWHRFLFDPGSNLLMVTNSNPLLDCSKNCLRTQGAAKLFEEIVHLNDIPWTIAYSCYMKSLGEERARESVFLKFPANVKKLPSVDIEVRNVACWEEALRALCYTLPMNFADLLLVEANTRQIEVKELFGDV